MEITDAFETFVGKNMFLTLEGEAWDFTIEEDRKIKSHKKPCINLMNDDAIVKYPLSFNSLSIRSSMSRLSHYLNSDGVMIGWGVKDLFTYHLGKTGYKLNINRLLLDIKLLESYMSYSGDVPKSYGEAAERLSKVTRYSRWEQVKSVYSSVYLPLIKEVMPTIETTGLVRSRRKVYPYYEIEGQANGRLKGSKYFKNGFNPHGLSKENLQEMKLGQFDDLICMVFDYSSLEVRVLQWLSGDLELKKVLENDEDVYKIIWERITNVKCTPAFREKCKSIFLPVVYGLGPKKLADKLKVGVQVAEKLIDNIHSNFSDAMTWIKEQQNSVEYDGCVYDRFGRRRRFDGPEHKIRNFVVQSPSSVICLHKLVKLYYSLKGVAKIVCYVHDGYMVTAHKKQMDKTLNICKQTLECKEDMYPELLLKVSTQVGDQLYKLNTI